MTVLEAMLIMRQGPLHAPLLVLVPQLGVAVEVTAVLPVERIAYCPADGNAVARGSAVVFEGTAVVASIA